VLHGVDRYDERAVKVHRESSIGPRPAAGYAAQRCVIGDADERQAENETSAAVVMACAATRLFCPKETLVV
jgi:hypothetical protein